jgi:hypothetical protein
MIHPTIDFALTLIAFLGSVSSIVNSVKLAARGLRRARLRQSVRDGLRSHRVEAGRKTLPER